MSVNRFDNDYSKFLESQDLFREDSGSRGALEVTSSVHLMDYVDPMKLQGRLDRIAEFRIEKSMVQYLEVLGGFDKEFLDHLESDNTPNIRVLAKGADVKVTIEAPLADLPLWEVPVALQIRSLYFTGVADTQSLDLDMLVREGVRRFQVKGDMLRNSNVRFVEAGTSYRYSFEWHSLLLQMAIGDMGDLLLGTTNMGMAMAFGLAPIANRDVTRVHAPSVADLAEVAVPNNPVVVYGSTAFEMAHLHSHYGDLLKFEWDRDLTGDMGPSGRYLPLDLRVVPKSG